MHTNCSVTISQIIPGTIVYPEQNNLRRSHMHTNCSVTISQIIPGTIVYPESLTGFINQTTDLIVSDSGQLFYHIYGE